MDATRHSSWRGRRRSAVAASLVLGTSLAFAAGCGGSDPDPPDPILERGPAPPGGSIVSSPSTLRAREGFKSLGGLEINSKAAGEALVVGMAVLDKGSPVMRLVVNDEPVESGGKLFRGGGGAVATIWCSCELETGLNNVRLEAKSKKGSKLGTRSLMAWTPAAGNDLPTGELVTSVGVEEDRIGINPSGSVMATTELEEDVDQVLVLAAYRSPDETSASPQAIRTTALLGGEAMNEVANASMPDGRLAVYYSEDPAPAGTEIALVGVTVTGSAHAHATTLAVCPCGLD